GQGRGPVGGGALLPAVEGRGQEWARHAQVAVGGDEVNGEVVRQEAGFQGQGGGDHSGPGAPGGAAGDQGQQRLPAEARAKPDDRGEPGEGEGRQEGAGPELG